MQNEQTLRVQVLLSLQRALLGEVSSSVRGVTVDWSDNMIHILCYFDGPISEEDAESMSCVETEVLADFPPEFRTRLELVRRDYPERLDCLREWVYLRREQVPGSLDEKQPESRP